MKSTTDLLSAVTRMHGQYRANRIDRDIMRGWMLGLPSYPEPFGSAVEAAKAWFSTKQGEVTEDVRDSDIAHLWAIVAAAGDKRP